MRRLLFLALLLATPTTTFGQCRWFRCRQPARPAVTCQSQRSTYVSLQAVPVQAAPQTTVYQATVGDEAGAFLAALNAWRAAYGRHPVGWDVNLAAWAAANAGYHSTMVPGASQTWAGTTSLTAALEMWKASPAHAAILLNATVSVGASPCPSGSTCNAR